MGTEESSRRRVGRKTFEDSLLRTPASGSVNDELARELVSEISTIDSDLWISRIGLRF